MSIALPHLLGARLSPLFERNFAERGEIGASVSLWIGETEWVNLSGGWANRERTREWTEDTLVPVWSATKGPAATACLLALEEAGLELDTPVCEAWPAFANAGKERVQFFHVLSHTAGLYALDEPVSIRDYAAVIHAIEHQRPAHPPGVRQAYHARTYGFLVDEIVRRLSGAPSLGRYFRQHIGEPMSLDFWIGLPESERSRVATLYPGRMRADAVPTPFMAAMNDRQSPARRAFGSPMGLNSVHDMNQPETWSLELPAMGGVGTARGLAQFYAMLAARGRWQGRQLVSERVIQQLGSRLSQKQDDVLCVETSFGAGMMLDPWDASGGGKKRQIMGSSPGAFGHPGAGGSLAFADPQRGFGFAYVMNQMELGVLPNEKALDLVRALDSEG